MHIEITLTALQWIFFSNTPRTVSRIDQLLTHNTTLSKVLKINVLSALTLGGVVCVTLGGVVILGS